MSTKEFERWLDSTEPVDEPTSEQIAQARHVLSSDGMRVIWAMLVGAAQGKRVELENAPLGTPAEAQRAAVIQGSIKGIYMVRDTLLELASMGSQPAAPDEEIRYGGTE